MRAEDGRAVTCLDISAFIRDLPTSQDTRRFSTANVRVLPPRRRIRWRPWRLVPGFCCWMRIPSPLILWCAMS
ncbi:P-loop domain-containing protein [Rothia sp. 11254D007CT]